MSITLPGRAEIEAAAFRCWQNRGMAHGHDQADWFQAEQLLFLEANYDLVARYTLSDPSKSLIGATQPRRCRYCGLSEEQVTFRSVAHALPELIGNRSLISMDECDTCNSLFSRNLDDHLAKFLSLPLTLTQVKGKNGVRSFKLKSGGSRIDVADGVIHINQRSEDSLAHLDAGAEPGLEIATPSQQFVPLAVFKCLSKMGLAIMPIADLCNFCETIDWIRQTEHAKRADRFSGVASCYHSFLPGTMAPDFVWTRLWRRKSPGADLPFMLFVVVFANQALQIMIPGSLCDNHWVGTPVVLPPDPVFYGWDYDHGAPMRETIPLASAKKEPIYFSALYRGGSFAQAD